MRRNPPQLKTGSNREPLARHSNFGRQASGDGGWMADASLPNNFDLLHRGEELIRVQTRQAIEANDLLLRHFSAIEASMTLVDHFARGYTQSDEDELTIQLLGLRLFNSTAGAVQCLMAGYYQNSVMLQRDILELSFLFDYFGTNRRRIAEWRACSESERNKKFSAFQIRTALDDRDGFTKRKRAEHYALCASLERMQLFRASKCFGRHPAQMRTAGHTFLTMLCTPR